MKLQKFFLKVVIVSAIILLLGSIVNCSAPVSFKTGAGALSSASNSTSSVSGSDSNSTGSTSSSSNTSSTSTGNVNVPPVCTIDTTNTPVVGSLPPGVTQSMVTGICPAIGRSSDCTAVIIISDSGVYLYYNKNVTSSYDGGSDDTVIGVLNISSSTTIKTLGLNSNTDIFGFDGEGIDSYVGGTSVTGVVTKFVPDKIDTTGYGGPNAYFTFQSGCTLDSKGNAVAQSPLACDGGVVNFVNSIAPGESTFFGLENALSSASACLSTSVN